MFPAGPREKAMFGRRANTAPGRETHVEDLAPAHRPDSVRRGQRQAPVRPHRPDHRLLADQVANRATTAVAKRHQRVAGDALTQVRELRAVIRTRLRGAAQLREHDDRDVQLFRQALERPRDRRQFQRAVLESPAARHELDIVDDQQVEPVLGLQPARLGAHLQHADTRRIVDEQLHRAQRLERVRDARVVLLSDRAAHQAMAVDLGLRRQHAEEQRLLRHFEAEEPDGHVGLRGHVLCDVEHETRLAHRRAGRDDDQVAGLKAARHLVQVDEAGRRAGDEPLLLEQQLELRVALHDELVHRHEAAAQPVVGDREDRRLRLVQDQVRFLLALIGIRQDAVGGVDQVPERRLFLDDARVVLDVGRTGHAVGERCDVGRATDGIQMPAALQFLLQRDEIDRVVPLVERHHAVEDPPVRITEEVLRVDDLGGQIERVVVDEDGAEDGPLGVEAVREGPLGRGSGIGHGSRTRREGGSLAEGPPGTLPERTFYSKPPGGAGQSQHSRTNGVLCR